MRLRIATIILTLYRTHGQALYKITLEEGVRGQHGQYNDDHARHAQALRRQLLHQLYTIGGAGYGGVVLQEVQLLLYLLQHGLYRDQVRVLNVHKAGEPVVPATYNVEQRDGRKTCLKQRQHDLEEYPPVTRAVDLGGLKQCIRDGGLYERPKDYDVIRADQTGQQEYPNGVIDVQVLHVKNFLCLKCVCAST